MVDAVELVNLPLSNESWFELETFNIGGRDSGLGQTVEIQDPRWHFEYLISGFTNLRNRQPVQTFLRQVRLNRVPVLCFDRNRRVPMSFLDGREKPTVKGSPWGAPVIIGHDRSDRTFTLGGWAPGTVLTDGDYFSFQDGAGLWHLHTLEEPATVGASGQVTLKVMPRPARGLTYSSATVRVRDACCQGALSFRDQDLKVSAGTGVPLSIRGFEMRRAFV